MQDLLQKTRVQSLGREDPLEKEMATHSRILAWKIPWTEEPGGLQSMGLQKSFTFTYLKVSVHCLFVCFSQPHSLQDFISPASNGTWARCSGSTESSPPDHREGPETRFTHCVCLPRLAHVPHVPGLRRENWTPF